LNANNSTSLNRWAGQQHWYLQHRVPSTPSIRTCHWYGGLTWKCVCLYHRCRSCF